MNDKPTTIVVPCFDEARRLDVGALLDLATAADARVLLVDDGSTDGTAERVRRAAHEHADRLDGLLLDRNRGKGEAVRQGMLVAIADGAALVGYYDADLATPTVEMARLVDVLRDRPELAAVLGARVALLGHRIERSAARHYLGRLFATASSLVLRQAVYDTQCGAKVFRDGPELRAALEHPFISRWIFDVELLARLAAGGAGADDLLEVPLNSWQHVDGSKLRARHAFTAGVDLVRVARARRARPDQPGARGASKRPTVKRVRRVSSST